MAARALARKRRHKTTAIVDFERARKIDRLMVTECFARDDRPHTKELREHNYVIVRPGEVALVMDKRLRARADIKHFGPRIIGNVPEGSGIVHAVAYQPHQQVNVGVRDAFFESRDELVASAATRMRASRKLRSTDRRRAGTYCEGNAQAQGSSSSESAGKIAWSYPTGSSRSAIGARVDQRVEGDGTSSTTSWSRAA